MKLYSSQKGVSLIAAVFIIVILAFMGVMFVSMISTGSFTSVNDLQSAQALYVAEGGLEFILENRAFPNYSLTTATTLGAGSFTVATPTYLTVDPGVAGATITVNSTTGFPGAGRIVIDSELINYTGIGLNTFTGATRGVGGTIAATHAVGNAVYPVAILTADPGAGGATLTVQVNTTTGFLIPGILKVDEEYIYCTASTATTFTNCTRNYKGTTADAHPIGRNIFQYPITSTGSVPSAKRQVKTAVVGTGNSFYKGWFAKNGAVGNQAIIGVGFQPTAVIFFWTRQTATGFATHESTGFGFAAPGTPPNQRSIAIETDDAANRSNYSRIRSDTSAILMLRAPAAVARATTTLMARANLVSLDADGFTINWVLNENRADIIHFIALGRDVTDAFAGTFDSNRTTNGPQSVTGVGFRPDFVMLLNSSLNNAEAMNTPLAGKLFNLGFMTPAGQGAISLCGIDDANNTTNTYSWQLTTRAILGMTAGCNEDHQASFSSMDADGFTINWNNAPGALNRPFFYLALKGGQYDVGAFNQPAATGNQTITGIGFQPHGLFMASANRVAIANRINNIPSEISIGAVDPSASQGAIWSGARNVDPSDANVATLTNRVFRMATGTGGGPQTINAEASFVRFNSDSFTVNWTTADATARQILYWTVGPNVARSGANIAPVNLDWREVYP